MTNEVSVYREQLPDTLEDLSRFVLVSEERIQALRAEIRAIKKVNLAKEVYEQKLAEAQEIGQITVEAAQKMGELLLQIQKQQGRRKDLTSPTNAEKSKTEITSEMGMTSQQVSQYQQMAQNPEAVQAAIQKAIENGDVVSRSQVMKEIRAIKTELAEKERKIAELENREPEIVTKEVVKEVVPKDYELLKKDNARTSRERQAALDRAIKAEQRVKELEKREGLDDLKKKVTEESRYFAIRTYDYIRGNGGFVWIFEQIEHLTEIDKKKFIDAIYAIDAFAKQMVENIGGYGIE